MALKLKENLTFEDKHGNIFDDCYAVIDIVNQDKNNNKVHFVVDVYKDKSARTSKKIPIHTVAINVFDEEYNEWFTLENIQDNPFKSAYLYMLTLEEFGSWESDESVGL